MKSFSRMETLLMAEGLITIYKNAWQWFSSRKRFHCPYKIFHEQRRRIEPDVKSQWAIFEVQWELSFLKRSKMASQLCTLYVRSCTLYVRVEFPGMHSLGMLLMQGFQFNINMLLAGLLGFFV